MDARYEAKSVHIESPEGRIRRARNTVNGLLLSFHPSDVAIARVLAVVACLSRRLSVRPSVTSRCSTETAKRRITQTTPHDSPGTLVFWCQKSRQKSNGVTPNGGAKCRCGRLNAGAVAENNGDFRREALPTELGRKFITLRVHLHVRRAAERRTGFVNDS